MRCALFAVLISVMFFLQQLLNDENRNAGSSNPCKMKLLERLMRCSDFAGSLSASAVCSCFSRSVLLICFQLLLGDILFAIS